MLRIVYRLSLRLLSWLIVLSGVVAILAYVFEESSHFVGTVIVGSAVLLVGAWGLRTTSSPASARARPEHPWGKSGGG